MTNEFNLVWFTAGFSNLSNYYISINIPVDNRIPFDANKAMFLAMIEPMARAPCSYYPLKLIGFHPYNFLNTLVSPQFQTARA